MSNQTQIEVVEKLLNSIDSALEHIKGMVVSEERAPLESQPDAVQYQSHFNFKNTKAARLKNRLTLTQALEKSPPSFEMFPWQLEDVAELIPYDRCALFTPVGGGKTVCGTLIATAWNDSTVLVLVPPVLLPQWVKWLNSLPNSGGAIAFRGSPTKRKNLLVAKYKWLVMSLQVFKNDHALLTQNYLHADVTTIVDEAHQVKNPSSGNYKLVRDFSECRKLLLMTGTPLNTPLDAFSYIKLKTPEVYRNFAHFQNTHVAEYDAFNNPTGYIDLPTISKHLYLQSAHRTKEEIHALLPKATYKPITYELAPLHKKLYDRIAQAMLLELPSGQKIDMTSASALYNGLQQTIVSWSHFAGTPGLRPAIFDVLDQTLDEIAWGAPGSSKLVIWSYFKRTTEAVLEYLNIKRPGSTVAAYSGANSAKSVELFENDPNVIAMVAQPGSAGAGTNFQHVCWESLFVEAPTRTIQFKQSAGRIDRTGQKYNPTQRLAIAEGTLQVSMFEKLLNNDDLVMVVQNETALRQTIFGLLIDEPTKRQGNTSDSTGVS